MVYQPFAAAFENLKVLFDKNSRSYDELSLTRLRNGYIEDKRVNSYSKVQDFVTKFIHFHHCIFTMTRDILVLRKKQVVSRGLLSQLIDDLEKMNEKSDKDNALAQINSVVELMIDIGNRVTHNVEHIGELSRNILNELEQVLSAQNITNQFLLHLLIICIFSVHNSSTALMRLPEDVNNLSRDITEQFKSIDTFSWLPDQILSDPELFIRSCESPHIRSVPESLSLIFVFNLVSK
jgi:hypothetical protein